MAAHGVAIIIPCFNDGLYVRDSVQSAVRQEPDELVVVDDGSDDPDTIAILAELQSSGVTVVRQTNGGLASARMTGVAATSARYVMALDADDLLADGALERMASALEANRGIDVVWGDVERFGAAGYRRYPKIPTLDPWRITFLNELVGTTMIRRTSLEAAGGWTLRQAMEDWDLWMAMAELGMVGRHVGGVTILYRVGSPRMYQNAMRSFDSGFAVLRSRHLSLFAARAANRKSSAAPMVLKWAWTFIGGLPLAPRLQRYALFGAMVVCQPSMRRRNRR